MKRKKCQVVGFLFTVLVGTLLHFSYEWSACSPLIGVLSAVNESVWEHLKLIAVPMLIFGAYEYFAYGRKQRNFFPIRVLSILLGITIILTVFYTYSGIIGRNSTFVDMLLFYVAVFAAYRFSAKMLGTDRFSSGSARTFAVIGLLIMIVCFVLFTFSPPRIDLFRDPTTGLFGASTK